MPPGAKNAWRVGKDRDVEAEGGIEKAKVAKAHHSEDGALLRDG